MFWGLLIAVVSLACVLVLLAWYRGRTIQDLVREPPEEVDLPQFVTILSYLHHELIKHRLPLVRTVACRPPEEVQPADVDMLKQAVMGLADRPSVTMELEGYLSGLQRAAGTVNLNYWRDPMVRRARKACRSIQNVVDGLEDRNALTPGEHRQLLYADRELDGWFRPRLQALRNTVLLLELSPEEIEKPVHRVVRELGLVDTAEVELPTMEDPIEVKMLRPDFDLVLRNLVRNALKAGEATGSPRVAIELATRLELTGEEAVLIRIHDTEPTLLKRADLYGGKLGRGLNIVTTTLRRYNGSLSCRKSKKDGYVKYLEVRLLRVLAEDVGSELLDEPDPLARMVPVAAVFALAAVLTLSVVGLLGVLPDPLEPLYASSERSEADVGVDTGPDLVALKARSDATGAARRELYGHIEAHQSQVTQDYLKSAPGKLQVKIPTPADIRVDPRRCFEPSRYSDDMRFEVECRLVNARNFLEPPALLLATDPEYKLELMEVSWEERVEEGGEVKVVPSKDRCMKVVVLPKNEKMVGPKFANHRRFFKLIKRQPSVYPRMIVNYEACLKEPRFPMQVRITLDQPFKELTPETEKMRPLHIDLAIRLRVDRARASYAKISNSESLLPDREDRTTLVKAVARYVARKLEYSFSAGAISDESSQQALSTALYFGWVRPGIHYGIVQRIIRGKQGQSPTAGYCDLYEDVDSGLNRMKSLDPKFIHTDLFRAEYYSHQAKMWILGDLQAAIRAMIDFQNHVAKRTDFVQGARFYTALMLTMGEPPESAGASGALGSEDPKNPVYLTSNLLRRMLNDSREPPAKGRDYDYSKIKLLGIHQLLEEDVIDYLGTSLEVERVICGFYEGRPSWVEAMEERDVEKLFSHCPRYIAPISSGSILDADAGAADAGQDTGGPLPVMDKDERRTMEYIQRMQALLAKPWSCEPGGGRDKRKDAPPKEEPEEEEPSKKKKGARGEKK